MLIQRRQTPQDAESRHFDDEGEYVPIGNLMDRRRVGLDPGMREQFVAIDEQDRPCRLSIKEYYSIAGFTRAKQKRELWLQKEPILQHIVRSKSIIYLECNLTIIISSNL